ncbi:PBECR2 nuclease fold domain-containing protein, partial [Helicobacter fennelliae]|uniref:portal protein n=1 Tax=Helicobacter fennelliae TaxID=215 RepID=UPI0006889022
MIACSASCSADKLLYQKVISFIQHYFTKAQVFAITDKKRGDRYFEINTNAENAIKVGKFDLVYSTQLKTQGRTSIQQNVIDNIKSNLRPELLLNQEGGFNGLPLILSDGQVLVGNHRAKALSEILSEPNNSLKSQLEQKFGVKLKDDEMIVRRLDDNQDLDRAKALAYQSNVGRESSIGEKSLALVAKYKDDFVKLPEFIDAKSPEEAKNIIAKTLSPENAGLNRDETALALLTHLSKSNSHSNIIEALDSIKGSAQDKSILVNMFVDNVGGFYNIAKDPTLKNINLNNYLLGAIISTSKKSLSRADDYNDIIARIKNFDDLTKEGKDTSMALNPSFFDDLKSQILGAGLSKFLRQENPSTALFDFLKNAKSDLQEMLSPSLFDSNGKSLSDADMEDFLALLISQGQKSKEQSELISLLPKLKELEDNYKSKPKQSIAANPQSSVSKVESSLDISAKAQYHKGVESSDIIFDFTKGKEHTVTKEVQQQWLETFNLKNLDEAYIPNFTPEVKQALDSILQGEDIKLYAGSLVKLIKENRLKYLDRIKPTLEQPQRIILQNDGALIFARNFGEEKYFTSVARNDNGEWIIRSNAPKAENGLNNKISAGGKEIYNSQAANQINAHNPYDDIAKSNIKLDNNIIPQTTQEIIKQAKASGKSVKETKELIQKNKELQSSIKENIESTPQKVDNSISQSLAQTKLSPSAQAKKEEVLARIESKKALQAKQAKQIYEFFTAKGTNKDKIKTLENFSDFMIELNKKLDRKWQFLEQQTSNDLAKYKQILTEGIEQAQQARRISPKQKQRALQDLDLLIDNFSYIKDTRLYSFHPSKVSEILHKIQYKAYDLEDLSDDEFMKILFDKKLPKTLDEDFEREFSKRKDSIYPFLKPMLAKNNSLEYISEQNLKDFFYKGVLRDEAIPEMIAKEKGVKVQDLSIAKIQDFRINSPRQSIEQALEIKPLSEFGTNYAEFYRDGQGAVKKLLAEKQGQVAGAFYRDDLAKSTGTGEIDLVWGNKGFGLEHIIAKHEGDFKDIAKELDEIIQNGEVVKTHNGYNITLGDYKVGLNIGWNENGVKIGENKWVVTAFDNSKLQSEKQGSNSASLTKGETLPLNSSDTIPQNANTINILKDMQDKDINVKLDNKELLEIYEKSSREAYDFLARKLYLDSVKQYRSDGYALFENLSLGADAKGSFEAILRKNIRQIQLQNFQKPQNVKYEIQTEQGFKYYLDENNDVVINHKNELVDFKGGVIRTKPDKDGDILELNGILRLISPRNADNMYLAKRDLTNNEFYDFHANLRLANYYQNGLFISDEKLYEVFKNMPRNADKQGLDDVMGILRGLTNSKNVNMAYAQEFIDKHYGLEEDYRTLARDIFKRVDKEYKKNGNPFGILFNDQKAIKDLRDMYGDEMARDFFKGKDAVDFLLYTQAGHIENAFYKEGLGEIDLVWGEVTGKGKEAKGWGLAKIIEKHLNAGDFEAFGKGEAGLINAMSEIIDKGKVITQNGVDSIILRKNGEEYRIGISKGWDNVGENKWIITSYKNNKYKESAETSYHDTFTSKEPLENLAT